MSKVRSESPRRRFPCLNGWAAHNIREFRHQFDEQCKSIQHYIATLESVFKNRSNAMTSRLVEREDLPTQEMQGRAYLYYMGLVGEFPSLLRSSSFVAIYSSLENALDQLCLGVRHALGLRAEPSDLKDRGIKRARTYLERVACVGFPPSSPAWKDLLEYNLLRNIVVHNDRGISPGTDDYKKVRLFADKKRTFDIEDSEFWPFQSRLVFKRLFCEGVLESGEQFIHELLKKIPDWGANPGR